MKPCDREGTFRGRIIEYGVREGKETKSVGVSLRVTLSEMWHENEWCDISEWGMETNGEVWVVKADGTLNDRAIRSLMESTAWNGKFDSLTNGTWEPAPCQVSTKANEYNGVTTYRINFVNRYDRAVGAVGNVDAKRASELDSQFGSQMRALLGNAKRNEAPPTDKPAAPPIAKGPSINQQKQAKKAEATASSEIPFMWLLPFILVIGCAV